MCLVKTEQALVSVELPARVRQERVAVHSAAVEEPELVLGGVLVERDVEEVVGDVLRERALHVCECPLQGRLE